jgi:ribonuclease P protein component
MSECFRLLIKDNKLSIGYYILIVPKKEILEKEYAEISQEIESLLRRCAILK